MLVKRCVSEKGKDMRDQGVDEEVGCRSYLKNVCPQNDIADIIIYVDDKTKEDIANEVLKKGDF